MLKILILKQKFQALRALSYFAIATILRLRARSLKLENVMQNALARR